MSFDPNKFIEDARKLKGLEKPTSAPKRSVEDKGEFDPDAFIASTSILPKDKKAEDQIGALEAFVYGVARGATADFAPEIAAAAKASWDKLDPEEKKSFGEIYRENQQLIQSRFKQAQEQQTLATIPGMIAGFIAGPGKFIRGWKALTAFGALEGLGYTDAPLITEGGIDLAAAGKAAAAGAALTAGGVGAIKGVGLAAKGTSRLIGAGWEKVRPVKLPSGREPAADLADKVVGVLSRQKADIDLFTKIIPLKRPELKEVLLKPQSGKTFEQFKRLYGEDKKVIAQLKNKFIETAGKYKETVDKTLDKLPLTAEKNRDLFYAFKAFKAEMAHYTKYLTMSSSKARNAVAKATPETYLRPKKAASLNKEIADSFEFQFRQGQVTPQSYADFRAFKATAEVVQEHVTARQSGRISRYVDQMNNKIKKQLLPSRYAFAEIDRFTGFETGVKGDILTQKYFEHGFVSKQWQDKVLPLLKNNPLKIGMAKAVKILENKKFRDEVWKTLSPDQQKAITIRQTLLNDGRIVLNNMGANIPQKDNYLTRSALDLYESVGIMKHRAKSLKILDDDRIKILFKRPDDKALRKEWAAEVLDVFKDRDSVREVRRYIRGLEFLNRTKIQSTQQLRRLTLDLDNLSRNKRTWIFDVGSALQKRNAIPNFLRENNADRLILDYVPNNTRGLMMNSAIRGLEADAHALRSLGMNESADWVERYLLHMGGKPGYIAERLQQFRLAYVDKMEKLFENSPIIKSIPGAEWTAKALPDMLHLMQGSVYPSFLGLNPRAHIRNLSQPFIMTAGEINRGYGDKIAMGAIKDVAKDQVRLGTRFLSGLHEELSRKGFVQAEVALEGVNALKRGLSESLPRKTVETFNKLVMAGYRHSDLFNRAVTLKMSKRIVQDMFSINAAKRANMMTSKLGKAESAIKDFIGRMEPAYKGRIQRLLKQGASQDAIENEVARYLIFKTQFAYGKAGMFQLGREMGPVLSMFTKWPTEIGAELHARLFREGGKGMETVINKYFYPLAALGFVSTVMGLPASPRQKELFYKDGLTSWSPLLGLPGIKETIPTPPVLAAITAPLKPISDVGTLFEDPAEYIEKVGNTAIKAGRPFIPIWGTVHHAYRRWYPIMTGEEVDDE